MSFERKWIWRLKLEKLLSYFHRPAKYTNPTYISFNPRFEPILQYFFQFYQILSIHKFISAHCGLWISNRSLYCHFSKQRHLFVRLSKFCQVLYYFKLAIPAFEWLISTFIAILLKAHGNNSFSSYSATKKLDILSCLELDSGSCWAKRKGKRGGGRHITKRTVYDCYSRPWSVWNIVLRCPGKVHHLNCLMDTS